MGGWVDVRAARGVVVIVTTGQVPTAVRTHGPSHRREGEEEDPGRETSPARRRAAGSRLLGVARVPIHTIPQHNYGTRKTRDQKVRECAEVEQRSVRDQEVRESAEAEQRSVRERRPAPEPRRWGHRPTCRCDLSLIHI